MDTIKGKVIVLGDDVDTDQILPGYAMAEPYDQLGNFAMAGLAGLDFKSVYEPGSIIVAGRNFGCGSSRDKLKTGDVVEVDLEKGTVTVNGEVNEFTPMAPTVLKTLEYGGLIPRVRAELGIE